MKQEDNPDSNLSEIETSDQQRKEALEKFINPVKTPRPKRNWLKISLWAGGSVLVAVVLVVVVVYETNKQSKPIAVPSTFDVSALKSVIGANDSVQMPNSNYFASAPTIWNEQSEVMTMPIPILFADNRIPSLIVQKVENPVINSLNVMYIEGLEQGDTVISPIDGEIELFQGNENMEAFVLRTKDSQGSNVSLSIGSATCSFEPLINFDKPIKGEVYLPVQKGQPICKVVSVNPNSIAELDITGNGPLLKTFNLATTSDGKVILLTK